MNTGRQKDDQDQVDVNKDRNYALILHNDDYHSFDFVIKALVKICGMDVIQATQCTWLIHFKDNCEIKHGAKPLLQPMLFELIRLGLKAEIK